MKKMKMKFFQFKKFMRIKSLKKVTKLSQIGLAAIYLYFEESKASELFISY